MPFDQERYEREVVRPLRNQRGAVPPPPVMYAIDAVPTDGPALEAHLRRVRAYWGQKARGSTTIGVVCRQLAAADEELRRGADLTDTRWWAEQFERWAADERQARQKLVGELRKAYAAAGQVTRAQLEAVAQHLGGGDVARAEQAARDAGLSIIDSLVLPADCGLLATQYERLRASLAEAGARTVVQLLHPGLDTPFAIARGFAVPGRPELRLDLDQLSRVAKEAERAADSTATRARKSALALLRSAYTKVPDLAAIALFHIVDLVRDAGQARLATSMLATKIAELGVARQDAELIASSLLQAAGVGMVRGLERIQQLIESGKLGEARAVLAAMSKDHEDYAAASALVAGATEAFEGFLRHAAEAEDRDDIDDAMRLLAQAADLDADDPRVIAARDRLPPVSLTFAEHASPPGVRLAWAASPGATGPLTYRIVRGDDHPPVDENDGVCLPDTAERQIVDIGVTPGRPTHYAVFASGNGTVWSRPATGQVTVVPRVGGVVLDADADSVSGRWLAHPAASEVRVRRMIGRPPARPGDGTAIAVTGRSFRDTAVRRDEVHHYEFVAVYHDASGREVTATPVVVTAVPRGVATPVQDLAVDPLPGDGRRVRLTWSAGEHDDIEVRRADRKPPWGPGERVSEAEARSFGTDLHAAPAVVGGRATVECSVPAGQHVYVPFSFGAGGAVVGSAVATGFTAPVTSAQLRRTADRLILTWVWPAGVGLAQVRWESTTFVISRAKYDEQGGCVLAASASGGSVEIRALSVGQTGTVASAPVTCTVGARATRVAYTVGRPVPEPGRPLLVKLRDRVQNRQRVVSLVSEQDCESLEVVVVAAAGVAMPMRAAQGTELARESGVRISAGVPYPIPIEVPASLRRPYWIRCFVSGPQGYAVTDPPIEQMKVA